MFHNQELSYHCHCNDTIFFLTVIDCQQLDASTHRGSICRSYGGVGRNLADGLTRLGHGPLFVSIVGDDDFGRDLLHHNPAMVRRVLCFVSVPCICIVSGLGQKSRHRTIQNKKEAEKVPVICNHR